MKTLPDLENPANPPRPCSLTFEFPSEEARYMFAEWLTRAEQHYREFAGMREERLPHKVRFKWWTVVRPELPYGDPERSEFLGGDRVVCELASVADARLLAEQLAERAAAGEGQ